MRKIRKPSGRKMGVPRSTVAAQRRRSLFFFLKRKEG